VKITDVVITISIQYSLSVVHFCGAHCVSWRMTNTIYSFSAPSTSAMLSYQTVKDTNILYSNAAMKTITEHTQAQ